MNNVEHFGDTGFFSGESVSVSNITERQMNRFWLDFQGWSDMGEETVWDIWGCFV